MWDTYLGAIIGKTNYIRNRYPGFSQKDIPRAELISKIEDTIIIVNDALNKLTNDSLQEEYPMLVFEKKTSTVYFLVHLTTHLAYHLGQINYHRRLLDSLD
jgi:uncharacterized damage-inducible protein DinB